MTPNERWYLSRSSKRRTPVVALILLAFMVIIVVSAATRSSSPTVTTIPGVAAKAQLNHFSTGSTTIYHNFTADMAKCTTLNCGMNAANRAFYAEGSVASNIDQSIYPARLISQLTMVEGYLVSLQKIYLYMTESKALTDITTQQARLAGPLGALTTTVATMIHDLH